MERIIVRKRRAPAFKLQSAVMPIIGLNLLFFIFQSIIPKFAENFSLVSSDVLARPWTLLTSMFLHGGLFHIFINMYILYIFGTLIEKRIGTKRFLLIYFISGILASVGFVLFQEFILGVSGTAVGASGAIMGILGVTIMLMPDLRVLFFFFIPMSLRTAGIVFVVIEVVSIIYSWFGGSTGIANSAHLVGLVCGLIYGYYLLRKKGVFRRTFSFKPKIGSNQDYQDSIHLSDEQLENYYKYGKL